MSRGSWTLPGGNVGDRRANAGRRAGETGIHEVEIVETSTDDPELAHVQDALSALQGAGRVALYRKKPTWCAGYLTSIEVGEGEELDLETIKQDWGGGEIQFRPQRHTANGIRFAPGGCTLRLTGPPRERGVEITPDGMRHNPPGPVVIEQRAAPVRAPSSDSAVQLLTMVFDRFSAMQAQFMQNMLALQAQQRPAPSRPLVDPLEQLRGSVEMYQQLRGLFERDDDDDDDDERSRDKPSPAMERLLELAVQKLAGDEKRPQRPERPDRTEERAGFRVHRATRPAAPSSTRPPPSSAPRPAASSASSPAPTLRDMLDVIRGLPPRERMELLGQLSGELDPELIKEWMSANFAGEGADVGT